jgi:arginine N-succinyltransferase
LTPIGSATEGARVFVIRDASESDLKGVSRLAAVLNTVNLPNDPKSLAGLIETSERSFAGKIENPFEREYLFVMEDLDEKRIIGTSQIIAQHGTKESPHIYFDVLDEERYSETTEKHFKHKVLRLGFDYDGPTEIGGLVLDPKYRAAPGKLGKQLSFVRFAFIGMHRPEFRDRVLAELLPPLGADGRSVLWEALGRRFTDMDYLEADKISKTNKEFIKNLFPSGMIYASLFDDAAQEVIGKVGPATEGVKKMLESVGFEALGRIDPFDGGPHFEAQTADIAPVTRTHKGKARVVKKGDIVDAPGEHADGLVCFEPSKKRAKKDGYFRALYTEYRSSGKDKTVSIAKEAAKVLACEDGDRLWVLPFATHNRL